MGEYSGMQGAQAILGLVAIPLLAWAFSEDRARRPALRWILGALVLQVAVAVLVIRVPLVWAGVELLNGAVAAIETATKQGSSYMFGYLGGASLPFPLKEGMEKPVIIAFEILPIVIVYSALAALLWHWGVLPRLVRACSWAFRRSLGLSGVVGLGGGTSLFLGIVEAPLVLRAYFERMSRSELFLVMVLAMATISGAILVLYAQTLSDTVDNAVGHMIAASLISLPAAALMARLMVPDDGTPGTEAQSPDLAYASSTDALMRGTQDGVQLFLTVMAVIIVVFALVSLGDQILGILPDIAGAPLTVERLFGWVFAPFVWLLGVPWAEAQAAGGLMGTKVVLNEYVAYLDLTALPADALSPHATLIMVYALCGVANLASVGMLVSTVATLAPSRRIEVSGLGLKSWIAGNGATAMTGAVVGLVGTA